MTPVNPRENAAVRKAPRCAAAGLLSAVGLALVLTATTPASACPSCASGRQARRQAWTTDFAPNLLTTALPFLVIAAIGAGVDRGMQRRNRSAAPSAPLVSPPMARKLRP